MNSVWAAPPCFLLKGCGGHHKPRPAGWHPALNRERGNSNRSPIPRHPGLACRELPHSWGLESPLGFPGRSLQGTWWACFRPHLAPLLSSAAALERGTGAEAAACSHQAEDVGALWGRSALALPRRPPGLPLLGWLGGARGMGLAMENCTVTQHLRD